MDNLSQAKIFVFHGPESFLIDYMVEKIVTISFTNPSEKDLNFHKFYGTETSVSEILSACLSYPMLAERKLIIVKEFDRIKMSKDEDESFKKYIEKPLDSTRLIITANKIDSSGTTKKLIQNSISVQCKNLSPAEIYTWVAKKYRDLNIEVEKEAISFLIENIGTDMLRLNQEIEKSIAFTGEARNVSLELISELTGFNREVNIFNFQRMLGGRNLESSLKIGLQLLEQQNAIEGILAMLYRFFKQVIVLKQLQSKHLPRVEIAKKLNQPEYRLKDAYASINNFTMYELKYIFDKIEETDMLIKSTDRNKESLITMLCYYICQPIIGDIN